MTLGDSRQTPKLYVVLELIGIYVPLLEVLNVFLRIIVIGLGLIDALIGLFWPVQC